MQISCPQCAAQYNVDDAKIPPQGVSIRCPRCQNTFTVGGQHGAAVPLPGAAPARPPAPAVALPGTVPLPGAAAVPLPGTGA